MNQWAVFDRMKILFPSLNKKRITWLMVVRAVNKLEAKLFCLPLRLDGYFIPAGISVSGKSEIYVNSKLPENIQIATAVHEVKHAAFDTSIGEILFSFRKDWTIANRRKLERHQHHEFEACAVASIALLPEKKLEKASRNLFDEEDEFLSNIWKIRLFTREKFGV